MINSFIYYFSQVIFPNSFFKISISEPVYCTHKLFEPNLPNYLNWSTITKYNIIVSIDEYYLRSLSRIVGMLFCADTVSSLL